MHKGHYVRGTVEGTGATITISCGFVPDEVTLFNVDGLARLEYTADLPDGYGIKTITAGTMSKITSLGITPYAGASGSAGAGFLIGADTDVNVSAETINWVAVCYDA